MADGSYLVKRVLIIHNKCSGAIIALNYVNRSKADQCTRSNLAHSNKQKEESNHPIVVMALLIK